MYLLNPKSSLKVGLCFLQVLNTSLEKVDTIRNDYK